MKKITKAIIPAAGLGTRMLPISHAVPKEMLPIVDLPAVYYLVKEAAESGITEDGFVWARIDDSRIMVCGYVGSAESITVPSAINSTPVTAISQSAFRDNATIVSVTVPESVVLIERDAFNGCSALSRVVLLSAEGWRYTSTATSTGGTEFLPEQLTDPALIAEYLRSTHAKYYWKK